MKLNDYQEKAMKFAKYTNQDYPFTALVEEVGEVMGKLAKFNRKNDLTIAASIHRAAHYGGDNYKELKTSLKKELGDALWQLQACCSELDLSLEEVAKANLDKLSGRSERGTIIGEGDER